MLAAKDGEGQSMGLQQLSGKVAVVTGAASGIGLALTERFVAEGAKVVLADVEEARLAAVATRLQSQGADVLAVLTDVTQPEQVEALRDQAVAQFGTVHVVCNNAGVAPGGPMLETTPKDWQWSVGVNLLGVAYGVIAFGPLLVAQGEGHIVNTASEAGLVTNTMLGMYCATKHGVVGLSESLYRELEGTGVGVSCLCPNLVKTEIFHSERNRPHGAELSATENATMAPLRESIDAMGIAPAQVAGNVIDAILADRFWIFTHPVTSLAAVARMHDIEQGRNPTNPYVREP
jgi:NAD(P)-dependent dehydrogenase (short-subunit alcohol dehydrogenase family)